MYVCHVFAYFVGKIILAGDKKKFGRRENYSGSAGETFFLQVGRMFWKVGKVILAGGTIILACGKIIFAGGKIILAGLVTTRQFHPVRAREFLKNGM